MQKKTVLFFVIIALLVVFVCMLFLLRTTTPFMIKSIEGDVVVDDYVGVNLDDDKLYFGTVSPKNGAKRDLILLSDREAFVVIKVFGEEASWIVPAENRFSLPANTRKNVQFVVRVPEDTPFGNYSIPIEVHFYRPFARLLFNEQ